MDVDINDNDVAQDNLADMNSEDLQQLIQNLRRQLQDAQAMGNGAPSSAAQNDLQQQLEEVRAELRDAQTQNQQLERKFKLEREDFARRKEIYKEEIRNLKQKNQASVEPDVILLRTRKALQTISDDYDDLLAEHSEKGRELRQAVANLDDSRAAHRRTAFKFKEGRKLYRELVDDKRDEFVGCERLESVRRGLCADSSAQIL